MATPYRILGKTGSSSSGYKIIGRTKQKEPEEQTPQEEENTYEPTTATGTFLRGAGRAPLEAIQNLSRKILPLAGMSPLDIAIQKHGINLQQPERDFVPQMLKEQAGDASHPIAKFFGETTGFLPLGGATVAGARAAMPAWNAIASRAMPSFLRRAGVGAVEGGGLGALYAPQGHELEGMMSGAAFGAAGYGIAPAIAKFARSFPGRFKSIRDLDRLRDTLEEHNIGHEETQQILEQARQEAKHDFNTENPHSLTFKINELKKQNKKIGKTVENEQPVNVPAEIPFEANAPKIKSLLETEQQNRAQKEQALSEELGFGETPQLHHERAGTILNEERNKIIEGNQQKYKAVNKGLEDKHVEIKNTSDLKQKMDEITAAITKHGYESPEVKQIALEIENIGKSTYTPGKEYLSIQKSLNNAAHEAWKDSKYNPDAVIRDKAWKTYLELKKQANEALKLLKSHMDPEDAKLLDEANAEFHETIIPMRRNPVFGEIEKRGKIKGNMLEKAVGTEEGIHILQDMIARNPELKRLFIGQQFGNKPAELHKANELVKSKYLPGLPKVQKLLKEHASHQRKITELETRLENEKLKDKEKLELKEQRDREIKAAVKEQKAQQEKLDKLKHEYNENNQRIKDMEAKRKDIETKLEVKNISAGRKMQLERQLELVEADKKRLKKIGMRLSIGIASAGGILATLKSMIK